MTETTFGLRVSVCICTRNRADDLGRCLASIERSSMPPVQVIVSDDGDQDGALTAVLKAHPQLPLDYIRGPQRGLGPNRNNAIAATTGSHLLFLDDDAQLDRDFLSTVAAALTELPPGQATRAIVTGTEINRGHTVEPNEQGMLGFQSRPYRAGEPLKTVVMNASLFPRAVFERLRFDPRLAYGYDEVDLTTRAVASGFMIVPCLKAANIHNPSQSGRTDYETLANASRLYVTLKRRRWTENAPLRAWAGFFVAGTHLSFAAIKRHGIAGLSDAVRTVSQAHTYYASYLNSGGTEPERGA